MGKNISNFVKKMENDAKGRKLVESIRSGIVSHNSNIYSTIEEIVKIAKTSGYDFSKEDFYNYISEQLREISEENLSKASGGKGNFGGGNAGKYAALVAGAAGVGGVSYSALSGNIFGGKNQENAKVENKDTKNNKKIDKKSLDGLDKDLKANDEGLYGSKSGAKSSKDLDSYTSSKLKSGLKRRTPSYSRSSSYGSPYGSSSYGSPYGSSSYGSPHGGSRRRSSATKENSRASEEETAINFLNKCTTELRKNGIDITPEQLSSAILNGELEKILGNKYINFAMALQSGNVDEAVNLVVTALTSNRDHNTGNPNKMAPAKPKRGNKAQMDSIDKEKVAEILDRFEKEDSENKKKEKLKQEKKEKEKEKEEEIEEKKEEIQKEKVGEKKEKVEEKKEKVEEKKDEKLKENRTEAIKSYNVNFNNKNTNNAPVKSFDIVCIENSTTDEEIKDWYTKVKENTKQGTAIMFVGKNTNKIEEVLKKLDKEISILKNKDLGENQFIAVIKDSEKKEVKDFFEKIKEIPDVNVEKFDNIKNGDLKEVVGQINKVFADEEKQKEKNKEQENLAFINEKIKKNGGIAKFQFLDKESKTENILLVNENADENKIKEQINNEDSIIIEILNDKQESKVKKIINGNNWKETENSFWSSDKAKSAKVFINNKKDIAKDAGTKNNVLQNFQVIKLEKENNEMVSFGTIEDFIKHVININSENKKKEEIKNKFQEKAKGTVSSDMNPNLMVEIKRILEQGHSVNVGVTFNNFRDQVQRKAAFIAKDHKIPDDITDCDFVIKKCKNPKSELSTLNKEQNWVSRQWYGDLSLKDANKFVALPTEGMDEEKTTIFVRQGAIDAYISNSRGKESIKRFLLEGEGKKYGVKEQNFEEYYANNYTPKNEKYWENIAEVYNSLPEFKNIINDYRDDISINISTYDYIDSAKNFLETIEIINGISPNKK